MILYDKIGKTGDLNNINLITGKSYTITYDIPFDKFLGKTHSSIINYSGKTAVITSISMAENNRTSIQVLIPGSNPFPVLILIYGLAALFAGLGVYLASTNIVKITEDVTKPSGVILIIVLAILALKFYKK